MTFSSLLLMLMVFFGWINPIHPMLAIIAVILPMAGIVFAMFGWIIPAALSHALIKYSQVLGTAGALFGLSYYVMISLITWGMGLLHNGSAWPMPIYFLSLSVLTV